MDTVKFTKRQLRMFVRNIISSAQKMSNLPYYDKHYSETDDRHYRLFIEDDALESIMKQRTDTLFKKLI